MQTRKIRYECFAAYDRSGIQQHLEDMARRGWMLEKCTLHGTWHYRRIAPAPLRFAVTYYSRASIYDPGPSEEQERFYDFCAHTGWKLAAAFGSMQIFYNENPDPVPLETDPVLEVENIHKSEGKRLIEGNIFLLILGFFGVWLITSDLKPGQPFPPDHIWTAFFSFWCFLLGTVELADYRRWYHRAQEAAQQGIFWETRSLRWLTVLFAGAMVVCLLAQLAVRTAQDWFLDVVIIFILPFLHRSFLEWGRGRKFTAKQMDAIRYLLPLGLAALCILWLVLAVY